MSFNLTNVINLFKGGDVYIKDGFILFGTALPEKNRNEVSLGVGSVYQLGNESKSYVNLSSLGPWHGNLNAASVDLPVYNLLTSLIPGEVPSISGPFSTDATLYSLQDLRDQTDFNTGIYFCKILGMGIGNVSEHRVSKVNLNGVNAIAENFTNSDVFLEFLSAGFQSFEINIRSPNVRSSSAFSITQTNVFPQTEYGANFYTNTFDWPNDYGLSQFNGTNTFPTFGWAGVRMGSIDPTTFQIQEDSLFNVPSTLLNNNNFNPIGIIYAGQGVQCCAIPSITIGQSTLSNNFTNRNNLDRRFEKRLNTREEYRAKIGIVPYQQGRGIFEYVSREPEYNRNNGSITFFNIVSTFGPEGAQPGRNNAFIGVALTDVYSPDLNLNNQTSASTTPQDTRYTLPKQKQTNTAHNAPLMYESTGENNTFNPLPWNSLNGYVGTTDTHTTFPRSDNTPVLTHGTTVMVTSGAFPLYRGSGFTEFSGFVGVQGQLQFVYFSRYLSQYYTTPEFWNPDNLQGNIPQNVLAEDSYTVAPNPPYRIKGGRIVLYENQHIIAGSYVYATIGMTGNVNMSQFYGPSAKEIIIEPSFRNILLGDLYSKYQSNQGGIIVMVSDSEADSDANNSIQPPPNIPPNCVPIGIVLESTTGIGSPPEANGQTEYIFQFNVSSDMQTNPDFENVYQLQNREILVQLFPMTPQLTTNGFSSMFLDSFNPLRSTTGSNFLLQNEEIFGGIATPAAPLYAKIRSCYTIPDSKYSYQYYVSEINERTFPLGYARRDNELLNDWPGPQSSILNV